MFVESVREASLSFIYILEIATVTLHLIDNVFSVTSNVRSDEVFFTC